MNKIQYKPTIWELNTNIYVPSVTILQTYTRIQWVKYRHIHTFGEQNTSIYGHSVSQIQTYTHLQKTHYKHISIFSELNTSIYIYAPSVNKIKTFSELNTHIRTLKWADYKHTHIRTFSWYNCPWKCSMVINGHELDTNKMCTKWHKKE